MLQKVYILNTCIAFQLEKVSQFHKNIKQLNTKQYYFQHW